MKDAEQFDDLTMRCADYDGNWSLIRGGDGGGIQKAESGGRSRRAHPLVPHRQHHQPVQPPLRRVLFPLQSRHHG